MIYLFCNTGYGQPFLNAAKEYHVHHGTAITVIYSNRTRFIGSPFVNLIRRLESYAHTRVTELAFRRATGLTLKFVRDINAESFHSRIAAGDHGIVTGFNQIFKNVCIRRFKSLVNFHPSVLPLYRGPTPSFWTLKNKEHKTGFTVHKITERIDEGEILYQGEVCVDESKEPEELDQKIANAATGLFVKYLDHLVNGTTWEVKQLIATDVYAVHLRYASFPSANA